MQRLALLIILPLTAFALAACPPPAKRKTYPDIAFTDKAPIALDVAEVRIDVPYVEPLERPHVGERFPVPPTRAARRWAADRLRAVGSRGAATVTILEASVIEVELEPMKGLKGSFTRQQALRYEATISIRIRVADPVGPRAATTDARVKRTVTVPEDATMNEREDIQYALVKNTINDFDNAMTAKVRQSLGAVVR